MKLIVGLCLVAWSMAAAADLDENYIVKHYNENDGKGNYKFGYIQSDGQEREEIGEVKNAGLENEYIAVRGSYSWSTLEPRGSHTAKVIYTVKYVADENGYNSTLTIQALLPTAVPAALTASILG